MGKYIFYSATIIFAKNSFQVLKPFVAKLQKSSGYQAPELLDGGNFGEKQLHFSMERPLKRQVTNYQSIIEGQNVFNCF